MLGRPGAIDTIRHCQQCRRYASGLSKAQLWGVWRKLDGRKVSLMSK